MKMVIVGTGWCGKTTLARRITDEVEAPFFDIDDLHWPPSWVERTKEEAKVLFRDVVGSCILTSTTPRHPSAQLPKNWDQAATEP